MLRNILPSNDFFFPFRETAYKQSKGISLLARGNLMIFLASKDERSKHDICSS